MLNRIPEWAGEIGRRSQDGDRTLGSLRWLGKESRLRGVNAVREGEVLSLARPLEAFTDQNFDGDNGFELEVRLHDNGILTVASDRLSVNCHGVGITHLDAINHFGVERKWYGGHPADQPGPSIADWARTGIVTRGVFLDIPAVRDTACVDIDRPVIAADLDAAIVAAGVELQPGDALIIYMGRDRFEATQGRLRPTSSSPNGRPGIGRDGAIWIAQRDVSVVLWDMLDAFSDREEPYSVHLLIWAQGLALVDNCDLSQVRRALAGKPAKTGLLLVAPLNVPGGTGSAVNPLFVT